MPDRSHGPAGHGCPLAARANSQPPAAAENASERHVRKDCMGSDERPIAAIATACARAGSVAIVRISGPPGGDAACLLFPCPRPATPGTATGCSTATSAIQATDERVDEALCCWMKPPAASAAKT